MKKITILLLLIAFTLNSNSQENSVRLGLFGLPAGQINLKYERLLNDNMSIGATVGILIPQRLKTIEGFMPGSGTIESFVKLGGFSIVPEFRFYPAGNGDLTGFYVAPALEFSNNSLSVMMFSNNNGLLLETGITGIGGSVNIGTQWVIGSGFTIDWNIFGIGLNNYFTDATLTPPAIGGYTVSSVDGESIENSLKSLPFIGEGIQSVTVDAVNNNINIKVSTLIPVPRMGLSLGWTF